MRRRKWIASGYLLALISLVSCNPTPPPPIFDPDVEILHSPVVAKSSEQVTFTAEVKSVAGPVEVQILVNNSVVQTCSNLTNGDTCSYTGGPYTTYQNTTVSYLARITDSANHTADKGYYYFAVTDDNYAWTRPYMPARKSGDNSDKIVFLFHMADDYPSLDEFIDDVEDKMYAVFNPQDIIEETGNFEAFNFYVYSKPADASSCPGTPHADTDGDIDWRDVDAILHPANMADCANVTLRRFTAEGSNTKAFLHESGHAVFGLADEYDSSNCSTYYFQASTEPNIWSNEASCQAEQNAKGRDPAACWEFTNCQNGWWGIFSLSDNTVMQRGLVDDPWGVESAENVTDDFDQY
jgi:hypothetical protein